MTNSLPIIAAKALIEFINKTNYELAPHGDGQFSSKDEAISFVDSNEYNPEEPLNVCFDTKQGDYWESAEVTFQQSTWCIEDSGMGGLSASGDSIKDALVAFRSKHDATCGFYPVELFLD